jgi:hypothetical protein
MLVRKRNADPMQYRMPKKTEPKHRGMQISKLFRHDYGYSP